MAAIANCHCSVVILPERLPGAGSYGTLKVHPLPPISRTERGFSLLDVPK